jgi:uncharacterized protein (DUF697 family)
MENTIMTFIDRFTTIWFTDKDKIVKAIIHASAFEAGCVGFVTAQIPGDRFVIGSVQVDMVIRLAKVYRKRMDRSTALAMVKACVASSLGPEAVNQVLKYVPGVGNIANTTVAGSVTEAIGWTAVKIFEDDLDWFDRSGIGYI